jgi:hypothetical protein
MHFGMEALGRFGTPIFPIWRNRMLMKGITWWTYAIIPLPCQKFQNEFVHEFWGKLWTLNYFNWIFSLVVAKWRGCPIICHQTFNLVDEYWLILHLGWVIGARKLFKNWRFSSFLHPFCGDPFRGNLSNCIWSKTP